MLPLRVPVLILVLFSQNQLSQTTAFSLQSVPSAILSSTCSRSRSRSRSRASSSSSSSLRPNRKRIRRLPTRTHNNYYYNNNFYNYYHCYYNDCKMVSDATTTTASSEATTTTTTATATTTTSAAAAKGPLQPVTAVLPNNSNSNSNNNTHRGATTGDIVTVRLSLTPEDGFVPEHLFDNHGEISLVLGWGNYLPGLHELLEGKRKGDALREISIDAGFGRKDPNLIIEVPKKNLAGLQSKTVDKIKEGQTLKLRGGITVRVLGVTPDSIVVDANHPLAGSSYSCSLEVLSVDAFPMDRLECDEDKDTPASSEATSMSISDTKNSNSNSSINTDTDTDANPNPNNPNPNTKADANNTIERSSSPYKIGTFAMGCFWGVELAFMRTPGVVATRAGYTQGTLHPPSYSRIKEGDTGHREAVLVVYDERVVSYTDILKVYDERLAITAPEYFKLDIFAEDHWDRDDENDNDNDDGNESNRAVLFAGESQYRHGIFYHDETQRKHAEDYIASIRDSRYCDVELGPAAVFYSADDHHQQYLYKGGQAARKGCREPIRCYG